jgi:hypothetical protein
MEEVILGHFAILEKIGEGGMGVVYKARDTRLERTVAIKALPESKATDSDRRRRFIQEAKAASALNHPNIVTIHEILEQDGHSYIVMEFVDGKPLSDLIPRRGLKLTEALRVAAQAADAHIVVRTQGRHESMQQSARSRVHDIDPELPLSNVRTPEEYVYNHAAQPRLNAALLVVFAGVGLLIAGIGVYGVLAYSVNQRTREIGLQMALGAPPSSVLWWIASRGMLVAVGGIGAGLAGAVALSRVLASLLFEIQPRDSLTFTVVAVLLSVVALTACLAPALRASRVDPIVALRDE